MKIEKIILDDPKQTVCEGLCVLVIIMQTVLYGTRLSHKSTYIDRPDHPSRTSFPMTYVSQIYEASQNRNGGPCCKSRAAINILFVARSYFREK